ncbi:MAG: ABC-type dipeptide/oligopeptide/nickel transport system, permease component [Acidimicrobiales bacterium]|nr:ABC-type dipeptide/oligopeptide/nickel transport system, permease component [Acidimicrobiales bacterium]
MSDLSVVAAPPTAHSAVEDPAGGTRKGIGIGGWLAAAWLTLLVGGCLLAPFLPLSNPNESIAGLKEASPFQDGAHFLGGDANGRDMFARLVFGARYSLLISFTAVLFGLVIGGLLGLISGYYRGRIGNALVSLFDILLAIPALVLALSLVAVLKGDPTKTDGFRLPVVLILILSLGIVSIPLLARITRANTLTWSQRDFVTSARAQGAKDSRIMLREVLPNVLPAMISIALLGMAVAMVAEGGLALLGASVEPPTATWGTMINTGRSSLNDSPFIVLEPVAAIFLTVLSLNYLGDTIRDRFDVRESAL